MPATQPLISSALRRQDEGKSLSRFTSPSAIERFAMTLPSGADPQRFAYSIVAAIEKTPKLLKCNPAKLWRAAVEAAYLGLPLSGALGLCYLIPYGTDPTLVPGYKGLIALAKNEGAVSDIYAREVYDCDAFDYELGTSEHIKHKPPLVRPNDAKFVAAYAVAVLKDGTRKFELMPAHKVNAIKARSRAGSGPWVTDFDEMAKKTAVRRLIKTLGLGAESRTARAVELDDAQDTGRAQDLGEGLDPDIIDVPADDPGRDDEGFEAARGGN